MQDFSKKLLFQNELSPLTNCLTFIDEKVEKVVPVFLNWKNGLDYGSREPIIYQHPVSGSLKEVLRNLFPLSLSNLPIQRELFISTKNNKTAYFNNLEKGSDSTSVLPVLCEQLQVPGYRIKAYPDIKDTENNLTQYGCIALEVQGLKIMESPRIIGIYHAESWEFVDIGKAYSFEDKTTYNEKRITDRFSFELLNKYCAHLELSPFDESFYDCKNAVVVESEF